MSPFFSKLFSEYKFVNLDNFLPANIKSKNPMQKYPHIIESFDCIQKMLDMFLFPINFLISLGICSTPKLSK